MSVPAGCQFVLQRGKNKGQLCGKTACAFSGNEQLCTRHLTQSHSSAPPSHSQQQDDVRTQHDPASEGDEYDDDQDALSSADESDSGSAMPPPSSSSDGGTGAGITMTLPPFPCVHNKTENCRQCASSSTLAQCGECDMVGPKATVRRHCEDAHKTRKVC